MDFLKWQVFLEEVECKVHEKLHFHLAQIVQYLVAINTEGGKLEPLQKYLDEIQLGSGKQKPNPDDMEARAKMKMKVSRAAWGAYLGISIPMDDLEQK